eukprot:GEMP01016889.1.p1 GENE.GEMP01016889.1~~GEMP01016889.1.p1  ORF type:complete len:368 (+),score=106.83 GEMP01016889.1:185-1288(+)
MEGAIEDPEKKDIENPEKEDIEDHKEQDIEDSENEDIEDSEDSDRGDWEKLRHEMLKLSNSKVWAMAVKEWRLDLVYFCDNYGDEKCLCGHKIKEVCELVNTENAKKAIVGNVCVNKFMSKPGKIVRGCKRVIKKGPENANLCKEAIDFGHRKSWLTDWEYAFYSDICAKRTFSERQRALRTRINEKVLDKVRRRGPAAEEGDDVQPKKKKKISLEEMGLTREGLREMVDKKALNDWERNFMVDNLQRSYFSDAQMTVVSRIQEKLAKFNAPLFSATNDAPNNAASPRNPPAPKASASSSSLNYTEWLTIHQLVEAKEKKYVSQWEYGFYSDNIQKSQINPNYAFSDKVKKIKNRIETDIANKRVKM